MSVRVGRLQPAVVVRTAPDGIGLSESSGDQYLYLQLRVTAGEPPERADLSFRFDGTAHRPFDAPDTGLWRAYTDSAGRYDAGSGAGWLLFELPDSGDASDAALRWADGEWRPGHALRTRLASSSPSLSVDWTVPETVRAGVEPTIEFRATNDTDRPGRFVGALNRIGPHTAHTPVGAVTQSVPPHTIVLWEMTDPVTVRPPDPDEVGNDAPDMRYVLDEREGSRQREVRIVPG